MCSGLVDLSLFAYSPAIDTRFSNINQTYGLCASATWPGSRAIDNRSPSPQASRTKPLPNRSRKNIHDSYMPSAGSRCVLRRIRRIRLDSISGDHKHRLQARRPSGYASARSAYINPNSVPEPLIQTLQERRNPSERRLTLPTDDITMPGSNLPMVWLQDEQIWLVGDPTDSSYGFYATGHDGGEEWLPPYTENDSPASEPSQSDLSPVREQFMSLMVPSVNPDEPQMSPLFQEALAGVGMLSYDEARDHQVSNRRDEDDVVTQQSTQLQPRFYRDSTSPGQAQYTAYNPTNNPWNSRLKTPRSASPALRADTIKYSTEGEIQRQKEREERGRMMYEREKHQSYSSDVFYDHGYNHPYASSSGYLSSGLSRRESWHSDSCPSAISPLVSPESTWIMRASSTRH